MAREAHTVASTAMLDHHALLDGAIPAAALPDSGNLPQANSDTAPASFLSAAG